MTEGDLYTLPDDGYRHELVAPRTLEVGDSLDGEVVLPGFSLPLADLFEA